jgi:hypothetical protein
VQCPLQKCPIEPIQMSVNEGFPHSGLWKSILNMTKKPASDSVDMQILERSSQKIILADMM